MHRLQQNVGITVACIPMLKPLFNKTLKLHSSYATPSRSNGIDGYGRRTKPSAVGYIREDTSGFEMTKFPHGDVDQYHTAVKGGVSDDTSETYILDDSNKPKMRVVKKTEITIEGSS